MPKALSIVPAAVRQFPGNRGAVLAAALFLIFGIGEAAASARASDGMPALPRGAGVAQQAGWEHRGSHLRLQYVVPQWHRPGAHRNRLRHHKPHRPPLFHGPGRGHKKLHRKRLERHGPRYHGLACRPVKVLGWHRGHRALFGQVLCVDRFGQRSILRGSRYLIRYLYH